MKSLNIPKNPNTRATKSMVPNNPNRQQAKTSSPAPLARSRCASCGKR